MSKQQDFLITVNKAIEEQVIPQIFSKAQLADMQLPYHEKNDHYGFVNMVTSEKAFETFHSIKPQLMIADLRISDEQLEAAPQSIKVSFEGKTHDIPLRIFRYNRAQNVQEWQENLDFTYVSREAIAKVETSLKQQFNLSSRKDYSIGSGFGALDENDRTKTGAVYLVQLYNKKAQKQEAAIKKHIEEQLEIVTPGRPSLVWTTGPIQAQ